MIRLRLICMASAFLPQGLAHVVIDFAADRLLHKPAHRIRSTENWRNP